MAHDPDATQVGQAAATPAPPPDAPGDAPPPPPADASPEPPRRRSLGRRILKWSLITLGVLLLLIILFVGFLHTGPGKRFVKGLVEDGLGERFDGEVTLGGLDYAIFGSLELTDLRIAQRDGTEVVHLGALTIQPDWGSLLGSSPALQRLAITDLTLDLELYEDGTSNLGRMVLQQSDPPERITLRELDVQNVNVTMRQPDGSVTEIRGLTVAGRVALDQPAATASLAVDTLAGSLRVSRPDMTLSMPFDLGLAVEARGPTVELTTRPMESAALLERPGQPDATIPIRLGALSLRSADGVTSLVFDGLRGGPLHLGRLEVAARLGPDGRPTGEQRVALVGLRIDHEAVNALLGDDSPTLLGDVTADLTVAGPPERLVVDGALVTSGGVFALSGTVDASDPATPRYDLRLTAKEVETRKLLAGLDGPAVATAMSLSVKGAGIVPGAIDADVAFRLEPTTAGDLTIDGVALDAQARGPVMTLDRLEITALGQTLLAEGRFDQSTREVSGRLRTVTGIAGLVVEARKAGLIAVPTPPLSGDLDVDLHLEATLADPEATRAPLGDGLVQLEGLPILRGRLHGHARGRDLRADGRALDGLDLDVDLTIADYLPKGSFSLVLTGIDADGQKIDRVEATLGVDGMSQDLVVTVQDEPQRLALDLGVRSVLDLAARRITATVHRFEVVRGPFETHLLAPVTFEVVQPDADSGEQVFELPETRLALAGGRVSLAGKVRLQPDPEHPEAMRLAWASAAMEADGLSLGALASLARQRLRGLSGRLSGSLSFEGTPDDPSLAFGMNVTARMRRAAPVNIRGTGSLRDGRLRLDGRVLDAQRRRPLVELRAEAPIALTPGQPPGLAPGGRLAISADVPRGRLGDLAPLLPDGLPPGIDLDATYEGHLRLSGTPARPTGDAGFTVTGVFLDEVEGLRGERQRLTLSGSLRPEGRGVALDVGADVWLTRAEAAPLVVLRGAGHFERSPLLPFGLRRPWRFTAQLEDVDLARLPLPEPLRGMVGGGLELGGDATDLRGALRFSAREVVAPGAPRLDAEGGLTLGDDGVDVAFAARADGLEIMTVAGTVGLAGRGLARLSRRRGAVERAAQAAPLDIAITVPRRSLAAWSQLMPERLTVPGDFGGALTVGGTVGEPLAEGAVAWDGFRTLAGTPGRVALELEASAQRLGGALALGHRDGAPAPVLGTLWVDRAALATGQPFDVVFEGRADGVDLLALMPDFALDGDQLTVTGRLDWDMDGRLRLVPGPDGALAPDASASTLSGALDVADVSLTVPGTTRAFRDVGLRLAAADDGLALTVTAREDDVQKTDRKLDVEGRLVMADFAPERATLRVTTEDWLAMGQGFDGPEAELDITLAVTASDLLGPVMQVDVVIEAMDLDAPDRFVRAHYQQFLAYDDVHYLDETGLPSGRLPQPTALVIPPTPSEVTPKEGDLAIDLRLRIPEPVRAAAFPLDIMVTGGLDVTVRGEALAIEGRMDVPEGQISVMGWWWDLVHGEIVAAGSLDTAGLALTFRRRPHDAALRDIAVAGREHAGDTFITVTMDAVNGQRIAFGGAAGPWLLDVATVLNTGRSRLWGRADLPASVNVQFGPQDQGLVNTFIQTNLTNLIFMDRANGWSDPTLDPADYGRIWSFISERYVASDSQRIRFVTRPPTIGQNRAELQYDLLFTNRPRSVAGAGARFGSDARLGLGLFWELSSD